MRAPHLPDSPWVPALVGGAAAIVFVLLRLAVIAHADPSRFIQPGQHFASAGLPRGVHTVPGVGYDGQFYYRLALDPANLRSTAFGISLDTVFRLQRIGYPALTWLVVAGHRPFVPQALIAVNVAAIAVLGWLGGLLARHSGRHALWGLVICGYFGFVFSLSRDLTEIVAAGFAVAGIIALRRRRPELAGLALAAAALSRETTLLIAGAVGLVRLVDLLRRRTTPGRDDLAWAMPGLFFGGWQVVIRQVTGQWALGADQGNVGAPLTAMVHAIGHNLSLFPSQVADVWLGELIVLVLVFGSAAWVLRATTAPIAERVAWMFAVALLVCLSSQIWPSRADFRAFGDAFVLSWILLLGSKRRLGFLAACSSSAWLVVFLHRIVSL